MVAEERPDLEEAKNALIISNAKMKEELKAIEDKILYRLSNSEGNPVDDVDLIKVLQASKLKSQEIQVRIYHVLFVMHLVQFSWLVLISFISFRGFTTIQVANEGLHIA